jgi:chromosomal replication initiation ATPase DnaA
MTGPSKDATTSAKAQLPLPLPAFTPSYARQSFIVSASNEAAWRAAQTWRSSRELLLVICGPEGSGKTHLANILAIDGGTFCSVGAPPSENHSALILFDDLPSGEPKAFLGTIDELMEAGTRVVLIGNGLPASWAGGFEDLRTRIESAPRATILEPDEALIETVIAKGFRDRQLEVDRSVVVFAAPRLPRTFAAAHAFVARADALALNAKRGITVPLAQQLVDSIS